MFHSGIAASAYADDASRRDGIDLEIAPLMASAELPISRHRESTLRTSLSTIVAFAALTLACASAAKAQSAGTALKPLDETVARLNTIAANPAFDRDAFSGAAANLFALAARWPEVRSQLVRAGAVFEPQAAADAIAVRSFTSSKLVSLATLQDTRFTGFTQSESTSAWCGNNVLVAFNDTGSEIRTIASGLGVSVLGLSVSANKGGSYQYLGTPSPGASSWQTLAGDPSVICADQSTYYYSALWVDSLNLVAGVGFAKSSDGGRAFTPPTVAVAKDFDTHFVSKDSLALDPANKSHLFIAYTDVDFSGLVRGTDSGSGSPIPRYAIELVASADGGASWSGKPTVIEQVCADVGSPFARVDGARLAVGPGSRLYVAWEAFSENGAPATSRSIKIASSLDNGASFAPSVIVSALTAIGDGADLQGFVRANEYPAIAIGKGKKDTGVVYLTWTSGTASASDMLSTTAAYAFADVEFSRSTDSGATWSGPLRVNNSLEGSGHPFSDQFEPAINADRTGNIGICFYDRRRDPNNFLIDRECAKSNNAGASWSNTKVTPASFPSVVGQDVFVASDYMGDYDAVAVDATGANSGLIDSFATNAGGNPGVTTNKF
jgi:hypothetical protein